jgi:predicted acyl esterase
VPVETGVPTAYEVEFWPTAYELAAGHRLQLRLTSADVPTHAPAYIRLDRNDPASLEVVPLPPAVNTVHQGGLDASYLLIPEHSSHPGVSR